MQQVAPLEPTDTQSMSEHTDVPTDTPPRRFCDRRRLSVAAQLLREQALEQSPHCTQVSQHGSMMPVLIATQTSTSSFEVVDGTEESSQPAPLHVVTPANLLLSRPSSEVFRTWYDDKMVEGEWVDDGWILTLPDGGRVAPEDRIDLDYNTQLKE